MNEEKSLLMTVQKVFSTLFPFLVIGVSILLCVRVYYCLVSVLLAKQNVKEIKSFKCLKIKSRY